MTLTEGTPLKCPHCDIAEFNVEDYVVPGQVGRDSMGREPSDCGYCDELFTVEHLGDGRYRVTALYK